MIYFPPQLTSTHTHTMHDPQLASSKPYLRVTGGRPVFSTSGKQNRQGREAGPCSEHEDPPSQTHVSAGPRASTDTVFSTKDLTVATQGPGDSENYTSTFVISPCTWNEIQTTELKHVS